MLLDRKRIRRWAKWVSLGLAIVFAGGFLFLGVGYGGAGFNISAIFTRGDGKSSQTPETPEEKIAALEAALAADPKDVTALLGLATTYEQIGDRLKAATYLQQVREIEPGNVDVQLRLAAIYMHSEVADYQAAVEVLNQAAELAPDNAQVFLMLGSAQKRLGSFSAAVLAWQRYLELEPQGQNAELIRSEIEKYTSTTTTTGASTTTTAGVTTTAGSSTTGSAGPTTTTTSASTTTSGR